MQHNNETMYQISEDTIIVSAFNAMIDYAFADNKELFRNMAKLRVNLFMPK